MGDWSARSRSDSERLLRNLPARFTHPVATWEEGSDSPEERSLRDEHQYWVIRSAPGWRGLWVGDHRA